VALGFPEDNLIKSFVVVLVFVHGDILLVAVRHNSITRE
jgi:hypothetical protein